MKSKTWKSLAILHQKGGTGKTTFAIAAALSLAEQGEQVLLLDADYQGTASAWGIEWTEVFNERMAGNVTIRSQIQANIAESIIRFSPRFDRIIVDAPPTLSDMSVSILQGVDRVLIPIRPSMADIWALATLQGLLDQMADNLLSKVFFSQVQNEDLSALRVKVAAYGLHALDAFVSLNAGMAALFSGEALPQEQADQVRGVLAAVE